MKITPKIGDKGKTRLASGVAISKSNILIEAVGTVDELSSFLGFAKSLAVKSVKKEIAVIQGELHDLGSELSKGKKQIKDTQILRIEKKISEIEGKIKLKRSFILPGKNKISASIDISRTICRRLERIIVKIKETKKLNCKKTIVYLNRLSYLLFLLARKTEQR